MIDSTPKVIQPVRSRDKGASAAEISMPSLREVTRVVMRHKWMVSCVFLSVSVIGVAVVQLMPNVYQSQASLMLRQQRSGLTMNPSRQELVTGAESQSAGSGLSESAILESQDLADEVVKAIGPATVLALKPGKTLASEFRKSKDPETDAQKVAAKIFKKSLTVKADGSIIGVLYSHPDPAAAHDILEKVIGTYQARHIAAYSSSASPEMFRASVNELHEELLRKQEELTAYQTAHNVTSVASERETIERQLNTLGEDLSKARVNKDASQAKIVLLEKALKSRGGDTKMSASEVANPDVVALQDQLRTLTAKKIELGAKFQDTSSEMREITEQIESVRAKIKTLPATVPRQLGTSGATATADPGLLLEAENVNYGSLVAAEGSLQKELDRAQARLSELRKNEADGTSLEAEVKRLNEKYKGQLSGLDQAEASAALDREKVSNVSVVQPATQPSEPSAPRRGRLMGLAVFAGLTLGLGLAFVREFFDDTLRSRDDAEEKLGLTVLAVVPEREFRKCI